MDDTSRRRFIQRVGGLAGIAGLVGAAGCRTTDGGADVGSTTNPPTGTPTRTDTATEQPKTTEDTPTPVKLPPVEGEWESYRHDAANTAATGDPGPSEKPTELWRQTAATGRPASSPVALSGAFVSITESGTPIALDAADGTIRWTASRTANHEVAPVAGKGTVVVADGQTLVGLSIESGDERWTVSLDGAVTGLARTAGKAVATTESEVAAVTLDGGRDLWHRSLDAPVVTPPAARDGFVALGLESGAVAALKAKTGTIRWQKSLAGEREFAPAVGTNHVYVPQKSRLVALAVADGSESWHVETAYPVAGPPAVTRDGVYLVTLKEDADVTTTSGTPRPTDSVWFKSEVLALTGGGDERWRASHRGTYGFHGPAPSASLLATDSTLFAVIDDDFLAYSADTGDKLWETFGGTVRPAVTDGVVSTGTQAIAIASGKTRWEYEPSAAISSSPAVVGNTVYVGSDDHHLYAVEANSGQVQWRTRTDGEVRTAPAVGADAVYAGTVEGTLYAFDRTDGSILWHRGFNGPVQSPTLVDGTLYIGYFDPTLVALDAADGSEVWRVERPDPFLPRTPAVADGRVFAGSNGELYAFDAADGTELWHHGFTEDMLVQSTPVVADGRVFVCVGGSLRAYDPADGTELWRRRTGGSNNPPAVRDGTVYVPGNDRVYAFDVDGTKQWQTSAGENLRLVAADGALYGLGFDTPLLALDPADGSELWRKPGLKPTTAPIPVDEYLFLASEGGQLHALGTEPS